MADPIPAGGEDELTPLDYLANRIAKGSMPGNAKYIFSKENWEELKTEVAKQNQQAVQKALEGLPFKHPSNGWCAKTNGQHPAEFKKCARCIVEDRLAEFAAAQPRKDGE